uniref:Patellin-3 n=1 Tax=Kalanchoe fedtschenkoi TaxID=63787 RepID=A0A7N1A7L8_KALFE
MAEETAVKPAAPAADEHVEKITDEKAPEADTPPAEQVAVAVAAEEAAAEEEEVIPQSVSFKEESNVVGDLPDTQKKALHDLKLLIQDALNKHEFVTVPPPPPTPAEVEPKPAAPEESIADADAAKPSVEAERVMEEEEQVKKPEPLPQDTTDEDASKTVEATVTPSAPEEASIWGIPLLADDRSDVILLKFLRARDFKVKEAFNMIRNTVRWRKEFKIDQLLEEEDLGNNGLLDKVVFMKGFDKEGHPVCYNVYGEFQNKDLYNTTLSDQEKRLNFLRWRIQFLEKSIRKLDFSPGGVSTIVQVNDLKNSPGPTKKELRLATNQALQLLQDNYPEFVAKQVFINVPWWYLAFNRMISPFLTQRTKSKFVFAGPSRTADTLFKYIAPEQVPLQYGGMSGGDQESFTTADAVTEVLIKPTSKHTIEIPFSEAGSLIWELRVIGWEVSYGAEFVPTAEGSYTVIVQKTRKILPTDEPVISNTFRVGEPGKVILTVDNQTSKKKKLVYRSKTKPVAE